MSDIEELTKERRRSAAPKKKTTQGEKKAPLIKCACGSSIPISKGTKCPTRHVQTPQVLRGQDAQMCRGCGQRELKAGKACDVCTYTWVNKDTVSEEIGGMRECSHCKRNTPKTQFCDHCDKEEVSGLTMAEMIEYAATGVTKGPVASKSKNDFKPDTSQMFPDFEEKQEARRKVLAAKRSQKIEIILRSTFRGGDP